MVPNLLSPPFAAAEEIYAAPNSLEKPESAAPSDTEPKENDAKKRAQKFLQGFKLTTAGERLIAFEALFDAGFPRFQNQEIYELLWPDWHRVKAGTRKRYGTKLCIELRKRTGKKWR